MSFILASFVLAMLTAMNEHSPHPFILRHPMSLGDAVAALFRGKPRRKLLGMDPPALRPPFKTEPYDNLFSVAKEDAQDSAPARFTELIGPH